MPKPKEQPNRNFESALEQLEQIVSSLEDGSLGLDESLTEFERGMKLLKQCHGLLQNAEQKIEVLTSASRDGQERTKPLEGAKPTPDANETATDGPPSAADPKSLF